VVTSPRSPYATSKLAHHPERLADFRAGRVPPAPTLIHLMVQNHCNHDCSWCSYRLSNWKNSQHFDESQHVPWKILEPTLREARAMGTKAIELTGGGEPLLYPMLEPLLDLIGELGFDLGIVTNGTAMHPALARKIGEIPGWKWARVSIDAGKTDTYEKTRTVGPTHWPRAWNAVRLFAEQRAGNPERRVGVGFVTDRENYNEVYDFCRLAKEAGADNVRLSLRFGPGGNDFYEPFMLDEAERQGKLAAAELDCPTFMVNNLIGERRANQGAGKQDYEPCYSMRLICVIGGDACVYTCCTLAFAPEGKIGNLREKPFREIWSGEAGQKFFAEFKVRERCQCTCLYEVRNRNMIAMVAEPASAPVGSPPPHVNFI
jgi:MoaA/NifB/PqqE/SkfB family radical SAM enzyme